MTTATKTPSKSSSKGHSKIFDPVADAAAKQRASARKKAAAGSGRGQLSAVSRQVSCVKQQDQRDFVERQLRLMVVGDAGANDIFILEMRHNIKDVVLQLDQVTDPRREASIRRRLAHLREQMIEVDTTLLSFGQKSNVRRPITDEIRSVKCSNGYIGRAVRDALFCAWRRHQAQNAPLREGDAA